jgi:hypothetical protein
MPVRRYFKTAGSALAQMAKQASNA